VILSHAEILSRRAHFAKQNLFSVTILIVRGVMLRPFSNLTKKLTQFAET